MDAAVRRCLARLRNHAGDYACARPLLLRVAIATMACERGFVHMRGGWKKDAAPARQQMSQQRNSKKRCFQKISGRSPEDFPEDRISIMRVQEGFGKPYVFMYVCMEVCM